MLTVDPSTGALTIVKAGSAVITVTAAETATYAQATKDVNVTVNKAAAVVTKAPTAKALTYNGQAQELVTAGSAEGGAMYYALGTDATTAPADNLYTTSIPTATEAGTYYVWYKVIGDANHLDANPVRVKVMISDEKTTYVAAFVDNGIHGIGDRKDCRIIVRSEPDESKAFDNYQNARMDAAVMPKGSHTAEKGSLILTLKDTYLDTLSVGKHKVTINFTDGSVDVDITVEEGYVVPKTGDSSNPLLWLGLLLFGLLTAGVTVTLSARLWRRLPPDSAGRA